MNKVHFVCLFGVDLDMDLLPFWADWYKKYDFDKYYCFLQSNRDLSENYRQELRHTFKTYGFETSWIPEAFVYGRIRAKYIKQYHDSLPYGDYLVCADSDEIHGVPADYKARIVRHDIIYGHTVDRYADTLKPARSGNLFAQYPHSGDVKDTVYDGMLNNIYHPAKYRILAARSDVNVNYAGSHYATGNYADAYGDFPVYHFAYRDNCLERMARKQYYTANNLFKIARFFGMDWHPAIDEKIRETERLQIKKGWVVA